MRLFVAVYPTPEVADALLEIAGQMRLPACRRTPREQLHVTLQFIGERTPREVDEAMESVRRSASGLEPFTLEPTRIIALPGEGPARLVAAETTDHPTLNEVKHRLVTRLARVRSRKPYHPHITLARFRTPASGFEADQPIPDPAALRFEVDRLLLMKSILNPKGAEHQVVGEVGLGE